MLASEREANMLASEREGPIMELSAASVPLEAGQGTWGWTAATPALATGSRPSVCLTADGHPRRKTLLALKGILRKES